MIPENMEETCLGRVGEESWCELHYKCSNEVPVWLPNGIFSWVVDNNSRKMWTLDKDVGVFQHIRSTWLGVLTRKCEGQNQEEPRELRVDWNRSSLALQSGHGRRTQGLGREGVLPSHKPGEKIPVLWYGHEQMIPSCPKEVPPASQIARLRPG